MEALSLAGGGGAGGGGAGQGGGAEGQLVRVRYIRIPAVSPVSHLCCSSSSHLSQVRTTSGSTNLDRSRSMHARASATAAKIEEGSYTPYGV